MVHSAMASSSHESASGAVPAESDDGASARARTTHSLRAPRGLGILTG